MKVQRVVNRGLLESCWSKSKNPAKAAAIYNKERRSVDPALREITGPIVRSRLIEWGLLTVKKRASLDAAELRRIFDAVNATHIGDDLLDVVRARYEAEVGPASLSKITAAAQSLGLTPRGVQFVTPEGGDYSQLYKETPKKYHNLVDQVARGDLLSVIGLKCLDCVGWSETEVAACECRGCPNFNKRPFRC